jgi:hypothetical protein
MVDRPSQSRRVTDGRLARRRLAFMWAYGRASLKPLARLAGRAMWRVLEIPFALLLLFWEWGWRPLAALLARIAHVKPIAALEGLIKQLPPYGALAVFALPSVLILPLKLIALVLIAGGHTVSAAALFIGAKVVGTALLARLFMLTEPALMQIPWFKRGYDKLMPMKDALTAWVRDSTVWKIGRVGKARVKHALTPYIAAVRERIGALRMKLLGR